MTVFYNDQLVNIIKAHVAKAIQSYAMPKFARIHEYDPETGLIQVAYYNWQTEEWDLISNWMAYMTQVNGLGDDSEGEDGEIWGHHYGPNIGEQVYVIPHNGDHNNGVVIGSIFTEKRPPPTYDSEHTASGEFLWKHKTGTQMKFQNTGDILITTHRNAKIHILEDGNIIIDGNAHVKIDGDLDLEVDGNMNQLIKGDFQQAVNGNMKTVVKGDIDIATPKSMTLQGENIITESNGEVITMATDIVFLGRKTFIAEAPEAVVAEAEVILPPFPEPTGLEELPLPNVAVNDEAANATPPTIDTQGVENITPTSATIDL